MAQSKTSIASERAKQGLLDDNELMAGSLMHCLLDTSRLPNFEASTMDDPFSTRVRDAPTHQQDSASVAVPEIFSPKKRRMSE